MSVVCGLLEGKMHPFDETSEFQGQVHYFPEFEGIIKRRVRSLSRIGTNEHGAVCAKVRLTLKAWNKVRREYRGAVFEEMSASVVQLKLF